MSSSASPLNMKEIKAMLRAGQKLRSQAKMDKKWGYELPLSDFALAMLCLNPQSYGARIDGKVSDLLGLSSSGNLDLGDRKSRNDQYHELKGSLITSSNTQLNLVQIRLWQEVDYIIYCFDVRDIDVVKARFFYLSKSQMEKETICGKAQSAHGTKIANANNANKELALRLEIDDPLFARWIKDYGVSLDVLKNKLGKEA